MTTRWAGDCGRGRCATCDGRGSQSPGPDTSQCAQAKIQGFASMKTSHKSSEALETSLWCPNLFLTQNIVPGTYLISKKTRVCKVTTLNVRGTV